VGGGVCGGENVRVDGGRRGGAEKWKNGREGIK